MIVTRHQVTPLFLNKARELGLKTSFDVDSYRVRVIHIHMGPAFSAVDSSFIHFHSYCSGSEGLFFLLGWCFSFCPSMFYCTSFISKMGTPVTIIFQACVAPPPTTNRKRLADSDNL